MFVPPRCPKTECPNHQRPASNFFVKRGSYKPKCRPRPVPRFQCKACQAGFSRQTFRSDYKDHRPDLNRRVVESLISGAGLRQTARILRITRKSLEQKARKISRHLRGLNFNLATSSMTGLELMLDEMISFEHNRRTRPLTIAVLIEKESMFVVDARSATIPPTGKMTRRRRAAIAKEETKRGKRIDQSKWCVRRVFKTGLRLMDGAPGGVVRLISDKKSTYAGLARQVFGARTIVEQHSGKLVRNTSNSLFRINLTNAIARDLNGRLRRRSWLASKKRRFLDLQLEIFKAWRNYHRPRFNGERLTPAQRLGLVNRRFELGDLLSWRQDWGRYSVDLRAVSN